MLPLHVAVRNKTELDVVVALLEANSDAAAKAEMV